MFLFTNVIKIDFELSVKNRMGVEHSAAVIVKKTFIFLTALVMYINLAFSNKIIFGQNLL